MEEVAYKPKNPLNEIGTNKVYWVFDSGSSDQKLNVDNIDNWKNFLLTKMKGCEHVVEIWANDELIWEKETAPEEISMHTQKVTNILDQKLTDFLEQSSSPIKNVFEAIEREFENEMNRYNQFNFSQEKILQMYSRAQLKVLQEFVSQKYSI